MKNISKMIIISLTMILVMGCDPCANTNCQNGGVCDNGKCDCPPGYSGSQCQNYNPCYNVTCQNGGTCVNGNCNCPTGYYGSNCQFRSACYFDNTGTISIYNNSASRFVYYLYVKINGVEVLQTTCNYGGTCNSVQLKVGVYAISVKSSTGKILCSDNLSVVRCADNSKQCSN